MLSYLLSFYEPVPPSVFALVVKGSHFEQSLSLLLVHWD